MSEYDIGKDIQELKIRVASLEATLNSEKKGKACGKSVDSSSTATVLKELRMDGDKEVYIQARSMRWDRSDSGDCESTYANLTFFEDGKWTIFQRTHDNGKVFGDIITIYIQLFKGGVEIERLYIQNRAQFVAGGTDEGRRDGESENIRRLFYEIDEEANLHIDCD
jgi:hypothetical protein